MTNRNPQQKRPLPNEIYQRRRVAALVIIVVVVVLLVWALSMVGGSGNDEATEPAAETTSESTPAAEMETTAVESETESESQSETESETESESARESEDAEASSEPVAADAKDTCQLADLKITASSDKATYGEGELPTFYMTVENPTKADCQINLDDQELRFEVYNLGTNQRMWADTDCYPSVQEGEQAFESGKKRHFQATWSRQTSAPEQCNDRSAVEPGGYYLHAVIGDNPSAAHTFNLS